MSMMPLPNALSAAPWNVEKYSAYVNASANMSNHQAVPRKYKIAIVRFWDRNLRASKRGGTSHVLPRQINTRYAVNRTIMNAKKHIFKPKSIPIIQVPISGIMVTKHIP